MDETKCIKKVWHRVGIGGQFCQCERKKAIGEYCKQHHPDSVKAQEEESNRRYAEESARRSKPYELSRLGAELAEMVLKSEDARQDYLGLSDRALIKKNEWQAIVAKAREFKARAEAQNSLASAAR